MFQPYARCCLLKFCFAALVVGTVVLGGPAHPVYAESAERAFRSHTEPEWVTLPAIPLPRSTNAPDENSQIDQTPFPIDTEGDSIVPSSHVTEDALSTDNLLNTANVFSPVGHWETTHCPTLPHCWQVLPDGLLYRSYAAGVKEPRMATAWLHDPDRGWIWESTLGGRVGLVRYGEPGARPNSGFQLDVGGAGYVRLDPEEDRDVEAADFSVFVPLTYRQGPWAWKLQYYHVSSHLGDEFLIKNPGTTRFNYVRDAIVLGTSYDVTDAVRVYGEVGYAFFAAGGAEPWEFQFGAEYSPPQATGFQPVPFLAVNAHLREEKSFSGYVNVLAGAQWRSDVADHLFRVGAQYYNGRALQWSFFNEHEELLGLGMWYEY